MTHDESCTRSKLSIGAVDNPCALDGVTRRREELLLRTLRALSEVFPAGSFPFHDLDEYWAFRRSLEELDLQLRTRSGFLTAKKINLEGGRLLLQAIHFLDVDLCLSRKQKLASMALSRDWSALPSHIWEGLIVWKLRLSLRLQTVRLRMGMRPKEYICDSKAFRRFCRMSRAAGSDNLPSYSDISSKLEKSGMTVANTARKTVINTGSLALNEALGVGGLPCGRIIEIFGGASTGKTTLALAAAGCAQQCGGAVAYIDAEHKLDLGWGKLMA